MNMNWGNLKMFKKLLIFNTINLSLAFIIYMAVSRMAQEYYLDGITYTVISLLGIIYVYFYHIGGLPKGMKDKKEMIIQNGYYREGVTYLSTHRYDATPNTGGFYADGGLSYFHGTYPKETLCLTSQNTLNEILETLVCEKTNQRWADMNIEEIKKQRKEILSAYVSNKLRSNYANHTVFHSLLHLYVGGYHIVQKSENKGVVG